jgi:phosphoglycolate phosphatase-like HAD superfamily hydrolase
MVKLSELMNIQDVMFDLDGTLIDTAKLTVPASRQAAEMIGLPLKSEQLITFFIGWPGFDFYCKLYPLIQDKPVLMEFAEQVEKLDRESHQKAWQVTFI